MNEKVQQAVKWPEKLWFSIIGTVSVLAEALAQIINEKTLLPHRINTMAYNKQDNKIGQRSQKWVL